MPDGHGQVAARIPGRARSSWSHPDEQLYRLAAAELTPATATVEEATLDDVFLGLTGRHLRESQETADSADPRFVTAVTDGDGAS